MGDILDCIDDADAMVTEVGDQEAGGGGRRYPGELERPSRDGPLGFTLAAAGRIEETAHGGRGHTQHERS
jgi:hypothetical protein